MSVRDLVYGVYEKRLAARLDRARMPRHVGVIMDGNRRWAKAVGEQIATGHQRGADKIHDLLGWCEEAGVEVVTLWLFSTDNFNRPPEELADLERIIEGAVRSLAGTGRWRIRPLGALDLLPDDFARMLKETEARTADNPGLVVNAAIGYGGRQEIADAVRSLLYEHAGRGTTIEDLAQVIDVEHISEHLYTRGLPDPDLLIRTSGEQRLSGFMLWQSAHSEFYFCEAFWPAFRRIDFLRALRDYSMRQRRFGA
ncbi:MAG TPA: isoprenyl transferase [Actinocrinis sp.]|jgi:short-chain Z-isoprenyl diphosphate synthase|uniref:isoprenyl transferase n=1 Tax=Actinocrinis sp. TaxID=1920516 RepID=UPI002DDCCD6E|nr:isoprenyl transferase [Actinocrinis sp.]HEV3170120.1 isoprenyl transferase [Actinocrinis sp.]